MGMKTSGFLLWEGEKYAGYWLCAYGSVSECSYSFTPLKLSLNGNHFMLSKIHRKSWMCCCMTGKVGSHRFDAL